MARRIVKNHSPKIVSIGSLKPHPKNYRSHPDDQLQHIMESIKENGIYRNVVIANDGTILAGHGVVEAAKRLGVSEIPVIRIPISPNDPRALKVMIGDNEIEHLAEQDDRLLSDILKEIKDVDVAALIGTGYDELMLANLVYVTRPASEISNFDAAAHWVGMPEYEPKDEPLKLTMNFETLEDKLDFGKRLGIKLTEKSNTAWWPPRTPIDSASVRFE